MDRELTYYRNKKKLEQTKYELMKLYEFVREDQKNPIRIFLNAKLKRLFDLYEIEQN